MNLRAVRLVRAAVVTATAVALTSTVHIAAGGAAPGLTGLATAFVLGTVLGTALLSGRRMTIIRTAVTIAGGQVVFHAVFTWGTAPTDQAASHAHGVPISLATDQVDAALAHDATSMLLAHVVAGLLSLAVLLAEVHLLDHLVVVARRAVVRLLDPASPLLLPTTPLRIPAARVAQHRPTAAAASPGLRRGPPALALAA